VIEVLFAVKCHNSGKQKVLEKYTPWYSFHKRYTFGGGILFYHKNWPKTRNRNSDVCQFLGSGTSLVDVHT
jgi:hypothetical protein